jgi:hypothetical protein
MPQQSVADLLLAEGRKHGAILAVQDDGADVAGGGSVT